MTSAEVNAHSAFERSNMTFQRRAYPKGNDGCFMIPAHFDDFDDFFARLREHNRIRCLRRMIRFVSTVTGPSRY